MIKRQRDLDYCTVNVLQGEPDRTLVHGALAFGEVITHTVSLMQLGVILHLQLSKRLFQNFLISYEYLKVLGSAYYLLSSS